MNRKRRPAKPESHDPRCPSHVLEAEYLRIMVEGNWEHRKRRHDFNYYLMNTMPPAIDRSVLEAKPIPVKIND